MFNVNITSECACAEALKDSVVVLNISRQEVRHHDYTRIKQQLNEFRKAGTRAEHHLAILFMGYANDPREVYQIPEIRKYVAHIYSLYPELYYYLAAESSVRIILLCLLDITSSRNNCSRNVVTNNIRMTEKNLRTVDAFFSAEAYKPES